jgi:ATP-binding cassette subfamily C protein CydD
MKFDRRLLALTGNIRLYVAATVGFGVLAGALAVAQAYCVSRVIGGVFLGGLNLGQVYEWLMVLLAIFGGKALLNWWSEAAANRAAAGAKKRLREPLVAHLLKLGPGYARGERTGELTNVATEGVEALDAYFSQYLPQVFLVVLVPLIVVAAVFSADVLSGVVLLVTAPVLPVFMALIGMMAEAVTKKQWKSMSLMSAHFLDVLQGLTTLKLFGRSGAQKGIIARITGKYRDATMGVLRVAFLSSLVLEIAATVSTAIIAVEVGLRLLYGKMPSDQAFFVLLLAPEFYMPFRSLGAKFHAAMSGGSAAARILDILEVKPLVQSPSLRERVPPLDNSRIVFEDVAYSYDVPGEAAQEARPALRGVSLTIEPGRRVALVGPSGAGKSTVAQLLLKFIEPSGGDIRVGERSLQTFSPAEWREQVAWVPQHPYLFNVSVAENIALGRPGASFDQIVGAARCAHIHDFIRTLPEGYDTVIGERGARLSGGQAQRIGLARAFLKNAPLLILDEATSNLDPEHEALIMAASARLMEGRTVLTIAHRLPTVAGADLVVVLEDGKVSQVGGHAALLNAGGLYSRLVQAYGGGGQ